MECKKVIRNRRFQQRDLYSRELSFKWVITVGEAQSWRSLRIPFGEYGRFRSAPGLFQPVHGSNTEAVYPSNYLQDCHKSPEACTVYGRSHLLSDCYFRVCSEGYLKGDAGNHIAGTRHMILGPKCVCKSTDFALLPTCQ